MTVNVPLPGRLGHDRPVNDADASVWRAHPSFLSWPSGCDVDFRSYAPHRTSLEEMLRGALVELLVGPSARARVIKLHRCANLKRAPGA